MKKVSKLALNAFAAVAMLCGTTASAAPVLRFCCQNIDGWGSAYFYQDCAWIKYCTHPVDGRKFVCGCDAWVTMTPTYMQGYSCPGGQNYCNNLY